MGELRRFGVSMEEELLEKFDQLARSRGYSNRSEFLRDLARRELIERQWELEDAEVAGTVTLVYDHDARGLGDELTHLQHDHHELVLSTMHVHLDERNCLEVVVLRGPAARVRALAHAMIARRGVKHGQLTMTSTGRELP
ncbi:MAG: nickel-responsive transcriptional regulator NikR [Firmicutes bacterium]|nr:nickel-responsive transcriptional regulator NikR [Bacillota bacterium]MDI6824166.1 nickel-responsive transcriptional regulator NikR [Bacillota bacterium]MDI7249082.1 nickel-responsive transcriptional regulator NikR [Bacillota bacterium]